MAFKQSPSVSNNPKIPTYLLFNLCKAWPVRRNFRALLPTVKENAPEIIEVLR